MIFPMRKAIDQPCYSCPKVPQRLLREAEAQRFCFVDDAASRETIDEFTADLMGACIQQVGAFRIVCGIGQDPHLASAKTLFGPKTKSESLIGRYHEWLGRRNPFWCRPSRAR